MKWKARPTLITLEGEQPYPEDVAELLGMDVEDVELMGGPVTLADIAYLEDKYPEYMGAIPAIIAKIGGAVVSGIRGIASAVKKRRARRKAKKSSRPSPQQLVQQQIAALQAQQQIAKQQQVKKLMMIGIPAGIGLILLMTMMNRPQPQTVIERRSR